MHGVMDSRQDTSQRLVRNDAVNRREKKTTAADIFDCKMNGNWVQQRTRAYSLSSVLQKREAYFTHQN